MKHLPWWMILSLPEWISSTKGIFCMYKGRVVEMWPSGYLVLLSTDSEAGWRDRRASMTWPICIISVLYFKVWLHSNGYVLCVCVSVPWLCLVAINIIWVELSWVELRNKGLDMRVLAMLRCYAQPSTFLFAGLDLAQISRLIPLQQFLGAWPNARDSSRLVHWQRNGLL